MRQNPLESRVLQSIFMWLLFAQLAFLGLVMLFLRESFSFHFSATSLIHWSVPIGVYLLDFTAWKSFKQKVSELSDFREIIEKVTALQSAYILLWVMVQAGTVFLLVFALLQENDYFVLLAVAQIMYFITLRPRLFNFSEEL